MKKAFVLGLAAIAMIIGNCGGDDAASSALSAAMGLIAVTSPTAGESSRRSGVQLFEGTPDNVKPLDDMITDVQAMRDGDPTAKAAELGNPLTIVAGRASCFGPGWKDDARTADNTLVNRPGGDSGIQYSTASDTDDTACVGAQLNALLGGTPSLVNNFVKVQGLMIAAAGQAGKALPGAGEVQDNTAVMPTLAGLTLSSATLTQLTDADGNATYKSAFSMTDANGTAGTVTIYHTPLNADNTNFRGLFQATLPYVANQYRGISMVYSETDDVFSFSMRTARNQSTGDDDFFGTDGELDFAKPAYEGDGHSMVASFNQSTNAATAHYAWQAGRNDGSVRAFGVNIPAGTAGSLTGTGYFGFGADISAVTDANTPWMTKMYCDWLNMGSGGTATTAVQRQTMTQTGGIFEVATDAWRFALTPSCTQAGEWDIQDADAAFLDTTITAGTTTNHSLVTPPTATNLPSITAPAFVIPAS